MDGKRFWSVTKSKCKSSTVPRSVAHGDSTVDSPAAIAQCFAQYFSTVYDTTEPESLPGIDSFSNFSMSDVNIFYLDILQLLY